MNIDWGILYSVIAFVASVCVMWGILQQKVKQMESRLAMLEKDHDLLVQISTKIDLLVDGALKTVKTKK